MNKMKYNITDQNLKIIINELGEEYKDLLIERMLDDMNEIDADLINPSDLIRLDVSTKSNLRADKKMQRLDRSYSMISLVGAIYALFGLMLMLWNQVRESIRYDTITMISFLLIFMGLFLAIFTLLYKNILKIRPQYYRRTNRSISPYEIINKWKEIEALVHELTPDESKLSLSSMIKNLRDTKIISGQDVETITHLLNTRNQIAHRIDNKCDLSQAELRALLLETDKTIDKMKKLI